MKHPEFAKWLWLQYMEWQLREGACFTRTQFASYLGIEKATLSQWMVGKALPRPEYAFALAKRLGIDVYKQLGVVAPDKTLFDIMCHWESMSEARKKELAKILSKGSAS